MRSCILALIFILISAVVLAQPGDPSGNPTVPITGIEILLSIGALLGIKSLWGKSKQK